MLDIYSKQTSRCLGALLVAAMAGCGAPPATSSGNSEHGQSIAPDSSKELLDMDGRPFDLWQGHDEPAVTVVVFTRSDCPISNRYAPTVRKLYETYQPQGVRLYLVYVDPEEGPESIRRHLKEFDYPCSALHDPAHTLVAATGANVTPEAVVFDSHRIIVYRGRINDLYASFGQSRDQANTHELADAIDAALAGRPVPEPFTKAVGCAISDLQ